MELEKVEPLTKQQAYDIALTGIRARGYTRAVNGGGACEYLHIAEDGTETACAVGLMFRREVAAGLHGGVSDLLDERFSRDIVLQRLPFAAEQDGEDLLRSLQVAHDLALKRDGVRGFEARMAEIARHFGLRYTTVTAAEGIAA
jgi:hypothetical protein